MSVLADRIAPAAKREADTSDDDDDGGEDGEDEEDDDEDEEEDDEVEARRATWSAEEVGIDTDNGVGTHATDEPGTDGRGSPRALLGIRSCECVYVNLELLSSPPPRAVVQVLCACHGGRDVTLPA